MCRCFFGVPSEADKDVTAVIESAVGEEDVNDLDEEDEDEVLEKENPLERRCPEQ